MLDGLRTASKSWLGKAIMTIVFGVIIVSFAIWGIGDIFRGFGQGKLGTVGSTEISSEAYRYAYQAELQRLQQRMRRVVTNDEARQAGLDRQVLGRLVTEAALDQKARSLGLAMSDEQLAKSVQTDPSFKDPITGGFDRARFDAVLRDNGLNERTFVREQKSTYLRQEIGEALAGALQTPQVMTAAVDRYRGQARSVDYVILTPSSAGEAAQPSDDEIRKFYEDRKAQFQAPQYRKIVTLAVTPASAAKPGDVSEAVNAALDRAMDARPEERRTYLGASALGDECDHGLEARDDRATVIDREHAPVDDPPREAHDPVGRREQRAAQPSLASPTASRCRCRPRGLGKGRGEGSDASASHRRRRSWQAGVASRASPSPPRWPARPGGRDRPCR